MDFIQLFSEFDILCKPEIARKMLSNTSSLDFLIFPKNALKRKHSIYMYPQHIRCFEPKTPLGRNASAQTSFCIDFHLLRLQYLNGNLY